jgi:hypothetical protein
MIYLLRSIDFSIKVLVTSTSLSLGIIVVEMRSAVHPTKALTRCEDERYQGKCVETRIGRWQYTFCSRDNKSLILDQVGRLMSIP